MVWWGAVVTRCCGGGREGSSGDWRDSGGDWKDSGGDWRGSRGDWGCSGSCGIAAKEGRRGSGGSIAVARGGSFVGVSGMESETLRPTTTWRGRRYVAPLRLTGTHVADC